MKCDRFACRDGSILWEHARKSWRLTEGEYLLRECLREVFLIVQELSNCYFEVREAAIRTPFMKKEVQNDVLVRAESSE